MSRTLGGSISHIALVSRVSADGHFDVVESCPDLYRTREVSDSDLTRRGWVFRGFGDVLSTPGGAPAE